MGERRGRARVLIWLTGNLPRRSNSAGPEKRGKNGKSCMGLEEERGAGLKPNRSDHTALPSTWNRYRDASQSERGGSIVGGNLRKENRKAYNRSHLTVNKNVSARKS